MLKLVKYIDNPKEIDTRMEFGSKIPNAVDAMLIGRAYQLNTNHFFHSWWRQVLKDLMLSGY